MLSGLLKRFKAQPQADVKEDLGPMPEIERLNYGPSLENDDLDFPETSPAAVSKPAPVDVNPSNSRNYAFSAIPAGASLPGLPVYQPRAEVPAPKITGSADAWVPGSADSIADLVETSPYPQIQAEPETAGSYDGASKINDAELSRFDTVRSTGERKNSSGEIVEEIKTSRSPFRLPFFGKKNNASKIQSMAAEKRPSLLDRAAAVGRVLTNPEFAAQALPSMAFGAAAKFAATSIVGTSLASTAGVAVVGGAAISMIVGGLRHDYQKHKAAQPEAAPEKNWAKAFGKDMAGFAKFSFNHVRKGDALRNFAHELKNDKMALVKRAGMGAAFGALGFGFAAHEQIGDVVGKMFEHGATTPDAAAAPFAAVEQAQATADIQPAAATAPTPEPLSAIDAQALKDRAVELYNGLNGVTQDREAALALFRQAAEAGNHQAIRDLAFITGEHVNHVAAAPVADVAAAPAPVVTAVPVPDIQPGTMIVPPLVETQPAPHVAAQCIINPNRFGEADCSVNQPEMSSGDSVLFTNETTGLSHNAVLQGVTDRKYNVMDFFSGVVSRNFNRLAELTANAGPVNYVAQQAAENIQTAAVNDNIIIPDFASVAPIVQ